MKRSVAEPATWHLPGPWNEDEIAMAVASTLQRRICAGERFAFAHDQNGARRSRSAGGRAKVMGMRAGEPDLRVYLSGGRIGHVELKTAKGVLSKEQRDRHTVLRGLGHDVRVVRAATPADGVAQVGAIVDEWLGK